MPVLGSGKEVSIEMCHNRSVTLRWRRAVGQGTLKSWQYNFNVLSVELFLCSCLRRSLNTGFDAGAAKRVLVWALQHRPWCSRHVRG